MCGPRLGLARALWCVVAAALACVWVACEGTGEPGGGLAEGEPCRESSQCAGAEGAGEEPGLVCLERTCQRVACTQPPECPDGACRQGWCALAGCQGDQDCPPPRGGRFFGACQGGLCVARPCQSEADCPEDAVCAGAPGRCQALGEACASGGDCPEGYACGHPGPRCQKPCTGEGDCPREQHCQGGYCRAPCLRSGECALGESCQQGRCAPPQACLEALQSCAPPTPFQDPRSCQCVACVAPGDCIEGQACAPGGRCVACAYPLPPQIQEAAAVALCQNQGRVVDGNCCVDCAVALDCPLAGQACEQGLCTTAPRAACQRHQDCPQPQGCLGGRCQSLDSATPCLRQQDCPPGEACHADGLCRRAGNACVACPEPSRCVALPGDTLGTCAGCPEHCSPVGCPPNARCLKAPQDPEGWCVADGALGSLCR